jgi:hypothetical protein
MIYIRGRDQAYSVQCFSTTPYSPIPGVSGVIHRVDTTWTLHTAGLPGPWGWRELAVSKTNGDDWVLVGYGAAGYHVSTGDPITSSGESVVWRSTDGGGTWSSMPVYPEDIVGLTTGTTMLNGALTRAGLSPESYPHRANYNGIQLAVREGSVILAESYSSANECSMALDAAYNAVGNPTSVVAIGATNQLMNLIGADVASNPYFSGGGFVAPYTGNFRLVASFRPLAVYDNTTPALPAINPYYHYFTRLINYFPWESQISVDTSGLLSRATVQQNFSITSYVEVGTVIEFRWQIGSGPSTALGEWFADRNLQLGFFAEPIDSELFLHLTAGQTVKIRVTNTVARASWTLVRERTPPKDDISVYTQSHPYPTYVPTDQAFTYNTLRVYFL